MRKILTSIIILTVINFGLYSQTKLQTVKTVSETSKNWAGLKVGDKCPNFKIKNLYNYDRPEVSLSDFKNKLLILDFWATWCGSCIGGLRRGDSLQKEFPNDIVILPVTYQKTSEVSEFMRNNKVMKTLNLPSVTQDTLLHKYFAHRLLPHVVWIDGNGIVHAITSSTEVTRENIVTYLKNRNSILPVKKDIQRGSFDEPLLLGGLGNEYRLDKSKLEYSSIITSYIDGMPGAVPGSINEVGDKIKFTNINLSIDILYRAPFYAKKKPFVREFNPDFLLSTPARMIWEAKDSSLYNWPDRSLKEWRAIPADKKQFCFEIIVPKADSLRINDYALRDLNNYFGSKFGIYAVKEKRKVKCWVLVKKSSDLTVSKGGETILNFDEDNDMIVLQNCTIDKFLFNWLLAEIPRFPIPLVDETDVKVPIDMKVHANPKSFIEVNKELSKNGLEFILAERELDMIVIKDKQ